VVAAVDEQMQRRQMKHLELARQPGLPGSIDPQQVRHAGA
jgi:hypothetical protein